jgi:hypothetical protein
VVKLVAETVAVQSAPKPRSSVTWTVPKLALRMPPGAAEPREAPGATAMVSAPLTTAMVAVQDLVPGVGIVDGDGAGDGDGAAHRDAPGPGQHLAGVGHGALRGGAAGADHGRVVVIDGITEHPR